MTRYRLACRNRILVLGITIALCLISSGTLAEDPLIAYCYQPVTGGDLHQIYVIDADGTDDRKLIDADIGLNHHSWSPDGSQLAAVGYHNEAGTWSIYTFSANGTNLVRLTRREGVWDSEPAWSPDGERISFTRVYPDREYREELWVMDADGTNAHWIGLTGMAAQWRSDGGRLVYAAVRDGRRNLYACAPDGTDETQLTDTEASEEFPSWSPDGTEIAFARSDDGAYRNWEIWLMSSDGRRQRQLTDNAAYDSYPRWSPDGTMLSFGSDRSSFRDWQIYLMAPDGSNVVRLTDHRSPITAINAVWKP